MNIPLQQEQSSLIKRYRQINLVTPHFYKKRIEGMIVKAIKDSEKCPSELKQHLLQKNKLPRFNNFCINLANELYYASQVVKYRRGVNVAEKHIESTVRDFTNLFIDGCINEAQQRYQSDCERLRQAALNQEKEELRSTINGKPQGAFEEMGVITDEKKIENCEELKIVGA